MTPGPGIEPGTHWWEASALTTAPPLLLLIDHEFRHNIVKVAVDPRGDSRVDPQTTLTML